MSDPGHAEPRQKTQAGGAVSRRTRRFYERFPFPGRRPVDRDGLILVRAFAAAVERRTHDGASRREPLRVLDAGCGTGNSAVSLAKQFPAVQFFAVDQSRTSLAAARRLAAARPVKNLRLKRWDLMKPLPYPFRFDIILCLGVLHHTADMQKGLTNLRRALTDDGELYLWVYGKHGRSRHALNMRLLSLLLANVRSGAERVDLAKEFAGCADSGSPLRDLLGRVDPGPIAGMLEDPVWIADQFLNPHETLVDLEELDRMAKQAHLMIERQLGVPSDIRPLLGSERLARKFAGLQPAAQQVAADLLLKPERYFVVMKKRSARRPGSAPARGAGHASGRT